MKMIITGDLVVTGSYDPQLSIDTDLIKLFSTSDYNIVNLEAPITQSENKIIKTGPHIKANSESTIGVFTCLNINIAALANNHIKDYDEEGVLDTLDFCHKNSIETVGAGRNIVDASLTHFINTDQGTVAIINIAENEWASADSNSAGANGMDLVKDIRKIQKAKKESDYVFVIVHGGHEYYNLPSPRMQEQYRFYAEQGADLVVGHHTHCVSGYEVYQGVPIYYSLGNFLFTMDSAKQDWYTGVILEIELHNNRLKTKLHPVAQGKDNFSLTLLTGNRKAEVLKQVSELSAIIQSKILLAKHWNTYIELKKSVYLNHWSPKVFIKNRYFLLALNKLKMNFTNTKGLAYFSNLMRCEAHHDLSKAVLKERLKK
ncbi:CapA family protein [Pseudoalteromonas sp. MelDa3]|uniref:CapA family protein n=1 Tax=Pseudoalteromonas sp. MelDa3 TaxID=888435 RepID=UPI000CC2ACBC|nr:CapA family protein [Pseudoalteromonas sp. MelDa3]PLT23146.1 hypothetical protein CXF89_21030 [Pseudoalteromonas sp. MelDa3]